MKRVLSLCCLALSLLWVHPASAAVDNAAAEVLLRKSCTENGVALNNCFTSLNALDAWIWGTRKPGVTSGRIPLHVSIGPGTFQGHFKCTYVADDDSIAAGVQRRGHVTLTGSGVNNSVLQNEASSAELVVFSNSCDNLTFESMTIRSTNQEMGVVNLGGLTVWNNVEIHAKGYAWSDGLVNTCDTHAPGKHFWNNSRIIAEPGTISGLHAVAYYNNCDDALFLGSELTAHATNLGAPVARAVALWSYGGMIRVYGGALRVLADTGVAAGSDDGAIVAVMAANPAAEIHVHGTGIDMISSVGNNLIALGSVAAMIHANGAAYMLKTGAGGTRTRVWSLEEYPRRVMAPYLWEPMDKAPSILSQTGQDTVVVTDTPDGKPHTLVYDEGCSIHWHDNNTNNCYVP